MVELHPTGLPDTAIAGVWTMCLPLQPLRAYVNKRSYMVNLHTCICAQTVHTLLIRLLLSHPALNLWLYDFTHMYT